MDVEINWLAVFGATAVAMIVGTVWYAKSVFGTVWMRLAGLTEAKMQKNMIMPMVTAVVGSLLTAYVLAHATYLAHNFFQNSFFMDALSTAFWMVLGFSATTLAIHNSFEQKPWKLTWLAIGNRAVTILLMGVVIGLLHP